jgi:hypothetical protein
MEVALATALMTAAHPDSTSNGILESPVTIAAIVLVAVTLLVGAIFMYRAVQSRGLHKAERLEGYGLPLRVPSDQRDESTTVVSLPRR